MTRFGRLKQSLWLSLVCPVGMSDKVVRLQVFKKTYVWFGTHDSAFIVPFVLDGQHLNLFMDTGTHESFVLSNTTVSRGVPCDSFIYGSYKWHPTTRALESTDVPFCDGSVASIVHHRATIEMGGQEVTGIDLGIVVSYTAHGTPAHSSLGLGPQPEDDDQDFTPILDQLVNKGVVVRRQFSIHFNLDNMDHGELILGGEDPTKYRGPSLPVPFLVNDDIWSVGLKGIVVAGMPIRMPSLFESHRVVIDSGTTSLHLPKGVYRAVMEIIERSTGYDGNNVRISEKPKRRPILDNCEDASYLPPIQLVLKGKSRSNTISVVIPSEMYVIKSLSTKGCMMHHASYWFKKTQNIWNGSQLDLIYFVIIKYYLILTIARYE